MKTIALAAALALAIGTTAADARLQLSIGSGGSTFTCFDGELSCDQSGGANKHCSSVEHDRSARSCSSR